MNQSPLGRYEELSKSLRPMLQFQMEFQRSLAPLLRFQEQAELSLGWGQRFQEEAKRISTLFQSSMEMSGGVEGYVRELRRFYDAFDSQARLLSRDLSPSLLGSIAIETDGSIAIEGQVFQSEEVKKAIDEFADLGPGVDYQKLLGAVEPRGGLLKLVVLLLLIPYLVNLVSDITNPLILEYFGRARQSDDTATVDARPAIKEAVKEAHEVLPLSDLKKYRVVIGSRLHIRRTGNCNAEIVDELEAGKIVHLLSKSGPWCQVEYYDSDAGEVRSGWVFSRYLRRLEK